MKGKKIMIREFSGDHFYLSNFYERKILYNGKTYSSTEHAYMAMKATNEEDHELIRAQKTPKEAKKVSRKIKIRSDWEKVKDNIMYDVCLCKFTQHKDLGNLLLTTGECEIQEGNNWGDVYWGVCMGIGKNKLGKILMQIRDDLISISACPESFKDELGIEDQITIGGFLREVRERRKSKINEDTNIYIDGAPE